MRFGLREPRTKKQKPYISMICKVFSYFFLSPNRCGILFAVRYDTTQTDTGG